jgi:hypothetical protein
MFLPTSFGMTLYNKQRDVNSSPTVKDAKRKFGEYGCVTCLGCGNNKHTQNTDGEIRVSWKTAIAKNVKQTAEY